ncbi:MAG TPA: AMP-binding protein [Solirubrobacteraceae bacterium]|nr:AMP-binding protein [Solirubrobacteraceae bacterium]
MSVAGALDDPSPFGRAPHGWRIHLGDVSPGTDGGVERLLGDMCLPAAFQATARREPDRPALSIAGDSVTHGQLESRVSSVGAWLADRGVRPGEAVIISAGNSIGMVTAYLSVLRIGAVAVLANPAMTEPELTHVTGDSEAVAAIAGGGALARLRPSRTSLKLVVDVDGSGDVDAGLEEAIAFPGTADAPPSDSAATALLAYTSGTTGTPKAVALSHRNLFTSIRAAMLAWSWRPDDVLVHALPLFHQHGLGGVHAGLLSGSRTVVLNRFDPSRLWSTMRQERASVLFAVPAMYERLANWAESTVPELPALGDLRLAVSGSAPLSAGLAERVRGVLGQLPLERYGTTESGLNVSNPYDGPRRPGTVGLPLPGVEVAIIDDAGVPVEDGEAGEIVLRGPQVFGGYRGDPAASAATFVSGRWFRTGDLGRIDPADGYLSIVGRLKELIITGGMNVYPREVESALELQPGVAQAAVVGVPSQRWGEEVVAVVVPSATESFDPEQVLHGVRQRLSPYKCPKRIVAVGALPRNSMGKLVRRDLVEVAGVRNPAE